MVDKELEILYEDLDIHPKYYSYLNNLSDNVRSEVLEHIEQIELLRTMVSKKRPKAKDLERDKLGRIKNIEVVYDKKNNVDYMYFKMHELENMDYFRERALYFQEHGVYTHLYPNRHPNSEFIKFWTEEARRCKDGYVRESDGEWISGYYYWYLNYSPILKTKDILDEEGKLTGRAERIYDFPDVWDSDYMFYHYVEKAESLGLFGSVLKTRGRGYSYKCSSMPNRNFYHFPKSKSFALASESEYLTSDGILNKAWDNMDWIDEHTPWRKSREKKNTMDHRVASYTDPETGVVKGTKSEIMGVTLKNNPEKARGKRGKLLLFEESGIFPGLLKAWAIARPSLEDGPSTFGFMVSFGTGGTEGAAFQGAEELFYNPKGYRILALKNIFDKVRGKGECAFFVPEYMNRKHCYDSEGNSDVIKALSQIIEGREIIRLNSSDPNTLTQEKADRPITPQESVMRKEGTLFPVGDLKDYLAEISPTLQKFISVHYIGRLSLNSETGKVDYKPDADIKIVREFPIKDNLNKEGGIEIFELPKIGMDGIPPRFRYISGIDPFDDDHSSTNSLGSMFVMDVLTDRLVCEYTARPKFANTFYENCLRILMFYNAIANYEAHPYSEIIHLPSGETKQWKDIKIGDVLFAPNGKTTKVIDIPVDENMPIYKVKLNDGRIVHCSDNHIWSLYKLNDHPNELKNYSTKELISIGLQNKFKQNNFFIPNGGKVNYKEKQLPIDPYTIGMIIAEGSVRGSHCSKNQVQISSSVDDMEFYKSVIPYQIKYIGSKGNSWSLVIKNCKDIFRKLSLLESRSETKFIPDIYLKNSYKNRLELLKGLMDGDGHATKNGSPVYVTSSLQLANNISSLCRSLGFNCKISTNKTTHLKSYKIVIYTDTKIFKLTRKFDKQHVHNPKKRGSKADAYSKKIAIKSIEFSHYETGKCVTVDNKEGRYLIGDYIVTHNCDKKGLFGYFSNKNQLSYLADNPQILKDMEYTKNTPNYGNKSKGVNSNTKVNAWGRRLQADWMLSPCSDDKTLLNLHKIRSIGYLKEAINWNPDGNFDRVSAMGMLMILREDYHKYILHLKDENSGRTNGSSLADDPFFTKNWDHKNKSLDSLLITNSNSYEKSSISKLDERVIDGKIIYKQ